MLLESWSDFAGQAEENHHLLRSTGGVWPLKGTVQAGLWVRSLGSRGVTPPCLLGAPGVWEGRLTPFPKRGSGAVCSILVNQLVWSLLLPSASSFSFARGIARLREGTPWHSVG